MTTETVAATDVDYLLEMMHTQRAMRHFRPDPVPAEVIEAIITAATYAPSGKNTQPWAFVVVEAEATRQRIGDLYREAWYETMPSLLLDPPAERAEISARRDWEFLANHMGDAPALVLVCTTAPEGSVAAAGSIFPAVQNLLLAARAYGVGSVLTTVHLARETAIKDLLGIPAHVDTVALIPLGYPVRAFGPVRRKPICEVLHKERWV